MATRNVSSATLNGMALRLLYVDSFLENMLGKKLFALCDAFC